MPTTDPRFDAYIAKAQPFAKPILRHLRAEVHAACPEVEETIKWGMPHFAYHGLLAGMASFKAHVAFGFWKGALVTGSTRQAKEAMWDFGCITSVKQLPGKRELRALIKKAMALNESGTAPKRPPKHPKPPLRTPTDLGAALKASAKAMTFFKSLPPSAKRDYIEWVTEAKQPATRAKRIATTVDWLAAGRRRNWKYEK